MQVSSINNYNNQPKFSALYKPQGVQYNEAQERIFKTIKETFQKKSSKFNGESAEDFYKSKEKLDFIIEPEQSDVLRVDAYKRLRERGIGIDKYHTYDSSFVVGRYNESNPFQLGDVDKSLKVYNVNQSAATISMLLLGLIPLTLLPWYTHQNKIKQESKPIVETVDTAVQTAKAKVPAFDTVVNVLKKVKK